MRSRKDKKDDGGGGPDGGPGGGQYPGQVSVSSDSADFWLLSTGALFENSDPQGAADVAQVIYNRVAAPGDPWKTGGSIRKAILDPGQFTPVSGYGGPSEWDKIKDKKTAIAFVEKNGVPRSQLETIASALLDSSRQSSARTFVGPRDSFRATTHENIKYDQLADDTEVSRIGHIFGFEPRGAQIGKFKYEIAKNRIKSPMLRDASGQLQEVSWPEALAAAAAGLENSRSGVLVGGRATVEDAYGYSKFARVALKTNNIDFRSRVHSKEELEFLSSVNLNATYESIDKADQVVLLGFEPEDESPIVFLRIYKQVQKRAMKVISVAPFASRGTEKLKAQLIKSGAGSEVSAIESIIGLTDKSVVLVGERLCETTGALSAVYKLHTQTNAKLGWIPRRAGEKGAIAAGAIPNLLPGFRPIDDSSARVDIATAWSTDSLPSQAGLSTEEMINSDLQALLIGGIDPMDISSEAKIKLSKKFIVSLEIRESDITQIASVVLPVAATVEKSGSFMDMG